MTGAVMIACDIRVARKKFFSPDPNVTGDHYGARNLRLWQVILVWILAVDLLVTMLWRL